VGGGRRGGLTDSGLAWPPAHAAALAGFPTARRLPRRLHRLSEHPGPWWYSSLPHGGGRFDLPAPEGTCYLADDLDAALGEKLLRRPKKLVPAQRLRELLHAVVTVESAPALADLTAKQVTGWGVNAEIHAALDYAKPRAGAARLRAAGAAGLRYAARSDPALRSRAVALFGAAGRHARAPAGMRTEVSPLDLDRACTLLEARGVLVVPIPAEVATVRPP
jgi:hypothetical protein